VARILLNFSSHIYVDGEFKIVCYYDGLIKAFKDQGNEVLVCNTSDFLLKSWNSENVEHWSVEKKKVINRIETFGPELVITFNNSKLSFIEEVCSCPIAIWEADSFTFYNDKEKIKSNSDRYYFLCLSQSTAKQLTDAGVSSDKIYYVNSATEVRSEDIEYERNVSFIGSFFKSPKGLSDLVKRGLSSEERMAISYLGNNFYCDPKKYLEERSLEALLDYIPANEFGGIYSCQNRIETLNSLVDLGLELYGSDGWVDISNNLPALGLCFNNRKIYSLLDNQHIYNSSKVCLNISHVQAAEGFPWRVMDIMASNGCLVSNENKGIKEFTKGYLDVPMYTNSYEARDLVKKIIKDDVYRLELVSSSQECIANKGRWINRFYELEEIFDINLVGLSSNGYVEFLYRKEYLNKLSNNFNQFVVGMAKVIPSGLHEYCYKLASGIGITVDYHTVKSVMKSGEK